jgi:urease subunit gamma/beta
MRLTDWEEERLLIFSAAELARRHRAAGLALNAPEAVALICDAMLEAARAGASYADVEAAGRAAVAGDSPAGVRELVDEVRLEVLMDDGTRLVALVDPLGGHPDASAAEPGPGAVIPAAEPPPLARARTDPADRPQRLDRGRPRLLALPVRTGQRPAAVRSRGGPRLPARSAGRASLRWAPGETREVDLVRYGGDA